MNNYPPGFGSARDLDHVEGPLSEDELDEACPDCGECELVRLTWRTGGPQVVCEACGYEREGVWLEVQG